MQRYSIECDDVGPLGVAKDDDGEYVRYDEAIAALAAAERLVRVVDRASKTSYCSTDLSCIEIDAKVWRTMRDLAAKTKGATR